jgi:hypothetical protein
MLTKSRGISLLAVAFAMAFLLSARIARADGVSDEHHDGQWSTDKDTGFKGDKGDFENKDWDGWVANDSDGGDWDKDSKDNDGGDSDNEGDGGKDKDPTPKALPEPSSLVLLAIGAGLTAFTWCWRNSGARQPALN